MRHRSLAAKRVWIELRHVFTLKAGGLAAEYLNSRRARLLGESDIRRGRPIQKGGTLTCFWNFSRLGYSTFCCQTQGSRTGNTHGLDKTSRSKTHLSQPNVEKTPQMLCSRTLLQAPTAKTQQRPQKHALCSSPSSPATPHQTSMTSRGHETCICDSASSYPDCTLLRANVQTRCNAHRPTSAYPAYLLHASHTNHLTRT